MADALQMFLMAGSPLQLGGSSAAKAYASETPMLAETLPFAAQLAEAGEQPILLTERQKAAAASLLPDDAHTEPVNPESLQAILADDQSTADEKDAARAWLAIIRAGQQESASITVVAASAKQGGASLDESADDGAELSKLPDDAAPWRAAAKPGMEHPSEAGKVGERLRAKAEPNHALTKAQTAADADSLESISDSDIERESQQEASKLLATSDARTLAAEKAVARNDFSADAPRRPTAQSSAHSPDLQQTISTSQNGSESDLAATEGESVEKTLSGTEKATPKGMAKQLGGVTASPAKQTESATDGAAVSKLNPVVTGLDSPSQQQQLQQDAPDTSAAAMPASVARADGSNQAQTLAAAVQARAEAQSNSAQAAASSGEQKSDDPKEQSTTSALLSAMQQARTEKGQASGERFDATLQQEYSVNEESLQRVVNSSQATSGLGLTGYHTAAQSATIAASTAQIIQSQGSASVQPASVSPSVSELLRQPLNLLAADASGQLRERLVMMVRNSVHSAEIKLDPAELGSMHIRVSMQQDQASVQFLVQQAHAKEILEQQLPKLRDMLGEQGIELADGQVSQQQSEQQQQQQTAGGNAMAEDDEALMQEQRLPVAKPSNRLVDYYA